MKKKQEHIDLTIGTATTDLELATILSRIAVISEHEFVEPTFAINASDMVLGPMNRFERAMWTWLNRRLEEMVAEMKNLTEKFICTSCTGCNDMDRLNLPCKEQRSLSDSMSKVKNKMWSSIRNRFGHCPHIAIRAGFVVVSVPSPNV